MKTTDLFKKHFGNTAFVDFNHPQVETFLEELNTVCLLQDIEFTNIPAGKIRAVYVNKKNRQRFLLGNYSNTEKAEHLAVNRLKALLSNPPSGFANFLNSK